MAFMKGNINLLEDWIEKRDNWARLVNNWKKTSSLFPFGSNGLKWLIVWLNDEMDY